ncbi:MAG: chemotaxis protein CheB [Bryobacteraceae bacterium]
MAARTRKKRLPSGQPADSFGPRSSEFPVVGIGASAGGLAAFEAFFSAMPEDRNPDMAFVLVQHLAPDHKSILTELVKRYTRMQVFEATDGMAVHANCAYIIPPNRDMAYLRGTLHLMEPTAPRGHRLPVDFLFRSLAQDQHERAICIVLSGTGSDGTSGLRAIKGAGGMAMAQDPLTTDYDGMPRGAIATGLVDYVLPPAEMPARLIAFAKHRFSGTPAGAVEEPVPPSLEAVLAKVFLILRAQTGHDFSGYKQNTIWRRIQRRMAVHHVEQASEYLEFLQQTPAEADALFRDFLIGVTSFFREMDAFHTLETLALPQIFAGKAAGASIRVWVPGCSSGEEAYSIAMLLQEQMELVQKNFQLQVFATDIDASAIEAARSGIYPASIAADITPGRLARHFIPTPDGHSYRVTKTIRDILIFSEQDVTRDPPFSRLDLVSCRNLLIYLGTDLQKKLIPLFHYALNPGGFLALGSSESVGEFTDLFGVADRKAKLFQRLAYTYGPRHPAVKRYRPRLDHEDSSQRPAGRTARESRPPLRELMERALLQQYAPASALVSQSGEIFYLLGRTGLYLEPVQGEASMNILKMAREGLRQVLTRALHTASSRKESIRLPGVRVKTNGDYTAIDLEVRPLTSGSDGSLGKGLFLILFEDAPAAALPVAEERAKEAGDGLEAGAAARIAALQQELRHKEEYLQSTIEEMETSSEELRSSHEEMQSVNEELQSANEELETSKEELQSVNEELATVNAELQQRVSELSRANDDMNNLLAGTGIGTIFVDHQLRIQRFTPAVTQVMNLIQSDIGRPVGHIVPNLEGYTTLVDDIVSVLESLHPKEVEVRTRTGAWYLLRIRPYRTLENVIEGAVIAFFDISEMRRIRDARRLSESKIQQMAASLPQLVWTLSPDGGCDYLNPHWEAYTGSPAKELLGLGWLKQVHEEDRDRVIGEWSRSLAAGTPLSIEFRLRGKEGDYRWFRCHIAPLRDENTGIIQWFGANSDIEDGKRAEKRLQESDALRRVLLESYPSGLVIHDRDGAIVDANSAAEKILGAPLSELLGKQFVDLFAGAVREDGSPFTLEDCPVTAARGSGDRVDGLVLTVPPLGALRIGAIPSGSGTGGGPYAVCAILVKDSGMALAGTGGAEGSVHDP